MDVWSHHFALQHHFSYTALSVSVDVGELSPNKNYVLWHECEPSDEYFEGEIWTYAQRIQIAALSMNVTVFIQSKSAPTYLSMWA